MMFKQTLESGCCSIIRNAMSPAGRFKMALQDLTARMTDVKTW